MLAVRVPEPPSVDDAPAGALGPMRPELGLAAETDERAREPAPSRVYRLRIALEGARGPLEPVNIGVVAFVGDAARLWSGLMRSA